MKLALLGKNSIDVLNGLILSNLDNVVTSRYYSISELVRTESTKGLEIDRLIITQDLLAEDSVSDETLSSFCYMLYSKYPYLRIVTLSKTKEDALRFQGIFNSDLNAHISMKTMKFSDLRIIISEPIEKVQALSSLEEEDVAVEMNVVNPAEVDETAEDLKLGKEKFNLFTTLGKLKKPKKSKGKEETIVEGADLINLDEPYQEFPYDPLGTPEYREAWVEAEMSVSEEQDELLDLDLGAEEGTEIEDSEITSELDAVLEDPLGERPEEPGSEFFDSLDLDESVVSADASEAEDLDINSEAEDGEDPKFSFDSLEIEDSHQEDLTLESEAEAGAEVDTDLLDVDLVGLFGDYQKEEADKNVKIVEKKVEVIVEKEVIKEVKVKVKENSAYTNVLDGVNRANIVVTGDRRSGVTTTALEIATLLGRDLDVLYVDLDLTRHGVLNYLNISEFYTRAENVTRALTLLETVTALPNVVYKSMDYGVSMLLTGYSDSLTLERATFLLDLIVDAGKFDVVVFDCPLEYISCLDMQVISCDVLCCLSGDKASLMNTATTLEKMSDLPENKKFARLLYNKIKYAVTGVSTTEVVRAISILNNTFDFKDPNWLNADKLIGDTKNTKTLLEGVIS